MVLRVTQIYTTFNDAVHIKAETYFKKKKGILSCKIQYKGRKSRNEIDLKTHLTYDEKEK